MRLLEKKKKEDNSSLFNMLFRLIVNEERKVVISKLVTQMVFTKIDQI